MIFLSPGFGADYDSAITLLAAWRANKTFVLISTGEYCSRSEMLDKGLDENSIVFRFHGGKRVLMMNEKTSVEESGDDQKDLREV